MILLCALLCGISVIAGTIIGICYADAQWRELTPAQFKKSKKAQLKGRK